MPFGWPSRTSSSVTWSASSRVGASTSAAGAGSPAETSSTIGSAKASVFPEPVGALPRMSRPWSASGTTRDWIRNGPTMPRAASDCSTSALTPSAPKDWDILVRLLRFGFEMQTRNRQRRDREAGSHGTALMASLRPRSQRSLLHFTNCREIAPPMKHLLATVGCLAAIFVVGGLDHLFPSGVWTALGVTLVFVTIGLVIAGALRLLWHGLLRLGVVHHGPPSFRVHGGETDIYVHRWKAFAYTVLPAACGLLGLVLAVKNGAPWAIWLGIVAAFAISGVFLWRYGPSRLLDRTPALVIDAHGIRDPVKGIEVGWDEVERLVPCE